MKLAMTSAARTAALELDRDACARPPAPGPNARARNSSNTSCELGMAGISPRFHRGGAEPLPGCHLADVGTLRGAPTT